MISVAESSPLTGIRALAPVLPFDTGSSFDGYYQRFANNWPLFVCEAFSHVRDITLVGNALTILLDQTPLGELVTQSTTAYDPSNISHSIITSYDGLSALQYTQISQSPLITATNVGNSNQVHILTFNVADNTVTIQGKDNAFLTITSSSAVTYQAKNYADPSTQQFKYIVSNGYLYLSTAVSATPTFVASIGYALDGVVLSTAAHTTGDSLDYVWKLTDDTSIVSKGGSPNSKLYKYYNCSVALSANSTCEPITSQTVNITPNALMSMPLGPVFFAGASAIDASIVPLKNFLTPQYQSTTVSHAATARSYDAIHFGNNQDALHDMSLSFRSDITTQTLRHDNITYFHFPWNALSISLSSSTLATQGAIAGITPETSDRIYKTNFKYGCYTPFGTPTNAQNNGVWLCSWLSGSPACETGTAIWMDRWYDPQTITQNAAMIAEPSAYSGSIQCTDVDFVWDVPSPMTLEPGCMYKYHRAGRQIGQQLASNHDSKLLFHVSENWVTPIDTSDYQNVLTIVNNTSTDSSAPLVLNGKTYGEISPKHHLLQPHMLTYAAWVHMDNWTQGHSGQILGNYYRGGTGLFYNNGIEGPMAFMLVDRDSGHTLSFNTAGTKISDRQIPNVQGVEITAVTTDRDGTRWIVDNLNKLVYGVDINGVLVDQFALPATSSISAIDVNSQNIPHVFDNTSKYVFAISTSSGVLTATQLDDYMTTFAIDINDDIIGDITRFGTHPKIGRNNSVFKLLGANLWKDNSILYHVGSQVHDFAIDNTNHIWIVYGDRNVIKLTDNGTRVFDKELPAHLASPTNGLSIQFAREYDPYLGDVDHAWIGCHDANKYVKMRDNGNIVGCISVDSVSDVLRFKSAQQYGTDPNIVWKGDMTGFDSMRRFGIPTSLGSSQAITARVKLTPVCKNTETIIELHQPTSTLTSGWHHFAVVVDTVSGGVKLYTDGILCDQASVTSNTYRIGYSHKPAFMIAAKTGKFKTIFDELNFRDKHLFKGKIDDIRIYDAALSSSEIVPLFWARSNFDDIHWTIQLDADCSHIEQISRFFVNNVPGHKSHMFDIRISGLKPTTTELKNAVERSIVDAIDTVKPGYTSLRQIHWT